MRVIITYPLPTSTLYPLPISGGVFSVFANRLNKAVLVLFSPIILFIFDYNYLPKSDKKSSVSHVWYWNPCLWEAWKVPHTHIDKNDDDFWKTTTVTGRWNFETNVISVLFWEFIAHKIYKFLIAFASIC